MDFSTEESCQLLGRLRPSRVLPLDRTGDMLPVHLTSFRRLRASYRVGGAGRLGPIVWLI